ncbi:hypothetical protein [Mycobacteroides abscessus]|uniref:hypothetical protein n=1 Tax=Mycobacteroides abscessus TaxID=36809 RepID=UPI0009297CD1|nr:hypothetical protein [Mycobacteroides abscessus]SIF34959.1 Uncharacterised protein [Mycobacteroides abscessus subsp. abscessus]
MTDDTESNWDEDDHNFSIACEALTALAATRWGLTEHGDGFRSAVISVVDDLDLGTPLSDNEVREMATTEDMLESVLLEWAHTPTFRDEAPPALRAEARRASKAKPATKPTQPIPEGADYDEWLADLQELHFLPAYRALAAEATRRWEPTFDWETVCDGESCLNDADAGEYTQAVADTVSGLDLARPLLLRDIRDIATRPEVLKELAKQWATYDTFLESAPPEALWLTFAEDLDDDLVEHFTVDGEPVKKLLAAMLKGNQYADRYLELAG